MRESTITMKRRIERSYLYCIKSEIQKNESVVVVVSNLTYTCDYNRWFYVCFLVFLSKRQIFYHRVGPHKDVALVYEILANVAIGLQKFNCSIRVLVVNIKTNELIRHFSCLTLDVFQVWKTTLIIERDLGKLLRYLKLNLHKNTHFIKLDSNHWNFSLMWIGLTIFEFIVYLELWLLLHTNLPRLK